MKPERLLRPVYRLYEDSVLRGLPADRLPRHIGIILDGHRRYARAEGLSDYAESYRAGMRKFEEFIGWAEQIEIPAITGWLLSKENLARPDEELEPYFDVLIGLFRRLPELAARNDLRVRFIGSLGLLPGALTTAAKRVEEQAGNGSRRLTIAMGYGGRQEIVDACRDLVSALAEEGVPADEIADRIDAEGIGTHLYTADLPDPDLVIRTSGESRLSGFLLWQSAYAEYAFVDVYWPAFRRVDFLRALRDFSRRDRRFGR
ncbi:(2Z,6E)-farnesyl diphosphate synthase [bacterium BMS3Abin02]|nr:(2Z,6E)-farnesyl diphosphate synthase [bacterium BMS3Abin02]GBE21169.1 (2Z,6E)-farnesyl diphosphate synthase [bacterium BMS3Bbin01]HDH25029.1 di-trans,poly-cis-decaprenylcistransferase [Actinomycetota bacterium]HDK45663.1 di-trans,poly-cis-decaprenylcistransferase [Actinomycetota bacterium]HDL49374.1 di-trans,poly-cis-decaprenylcistransferase [Actinomycetota bacterium]